jgi:hypothetical protein
VKNQCYRQHARGAWDDVDQYDKKNYEEFGDVTILEDVVVGWVDTDQKDHKHQELGEAVPQKSCPFSSGGRLVLALFALVGLDARAGTVRYRGTGT